MRLFRYIFMAAALTALPLVAMAQEGHEDHAPKPATLNITAQVDVKAAPDIAHISAGVVTVAKTAQEAMSENAKQMNAVFAAMKKAGIADKDQQTSGMNISPQYVYEQNKSPVITGYQAHNNVNVLVRDLKNIGPVMDALVAQGANQINGPSFSIEDSEDLLNEARKEAVQKAQKRAAIYAAAAGMKIARIQSIDENSHSQGPIPYQPMMRAMAMKDSAESSTPVASGEVTLSISTNIVYELE